MNTRFHIPAPWPTPACAHTEFVLPEAVFHHAITVLRMRTGDVLALFDGAGQVARATLSRIDKKTAHAQWLESAQRMTANESPLHITLAQCVSATDKMDWTIEKAVELGVQRIVPLFSHKSQIKLSAERAEKKYAHWQRIIVAACTQSGRNVCPELTAPVGLNQWLTQNKHDANNHDGCALILHPDPHNPRTLSQIKRPATATTTTPITLLIGPESGFAPQELAAAHAAQFTAVTLGPRVLRTESAGLAAIAALQALWGDY